MEKIKIGDTVRMSDELKNGLIENNCQEHVDEFGECEGIVESWIYPNTDIKDVNVRWKPSELRYGYNIETLVNVL